MRSTQSWMSLVWSVMASNLLRLNRVRPIFMLARMVAAPPTPIHCRLLREKSGIFFLMVSSDCISERISETVLRIKTSRSPFSLGVGGSER